MKVYVLTFNDGGDNEIFMGVVTDLSLVKNRNFYNIYSVEMDSDFCIDRARDKDALAQEFTII